MAGGMRLHANYSNETVLFRRAIPIRLTSWIDNRTGEMLRAGVARRTAAVVVRNFWARRPWLTNAPANSGAAQFFPDDEEF